MKLHEAVKAKDYKLFESLLNSGHDICEVNQFGDTVLHLLAQNKESESVVGGIFSSLSSKAKLHDWLFLIQSSVEKNIKTQHSMSDFATMQNILSQTCMHIAIKNENWEFAYFMQKNYLHYKIYPNRLKRDDHGFTEYELALALYGIWGRSDEMNAVFGDLAKFSIQDLGYFSPFTKNNSIIYGLKETKKAMKAVKIISLPLKEGNNFNYILQMNNELFQYAIEDEYPSAFASFNEDSHWHSLYCQLKLAEHSDCAPPSQHIYVNIHEDE